MSLASSLLIFALLVVILSLLRTRLVFELSSTSLLFFGSTSPGLWLYTLIFLPGTIIHELSHWIVAELLGVKTGEISIFPDFKSEESEHRLGSVATIKTDPLRGFLIGVAPFVTGLAILFVLGRLLFLGFGLYPWWQLALVIYGIMVTGNSMMISKADRQTWPIVIFFSILIIFIFSRLEIKPTQDIFPNLINIISNLNLVLGVTTGFNLVMIGGSYSLRRLAESLTKKRIIRK